MININSYAKRDSQHNKTPIIYASYICLKEFSAGENPKKKIAHVLMHYFSNVFFFLLPWSAKAYPCVSRGCLTEDVKCAAIVRYTKGNDGKC